MPLSVMRCEATKIALGPSRLSPAVMSRQRHPLTDKNPRSMETLNSNSRKVLIWEVGSRQSLGFLPSGGQYSSTAPRKSVSGQGATGAPCALSGNLRSEEHKSELQSRQYLVC